jgi:hypothetical protein
LKYLHGNGCPLNENICSIAAQYGQLECLKYLHGNGCPLNENICSIAAQYGQLECLKYLHGNGCPLNENICSVVLHSLLDACNIAYHYDKYSPNTFDVRNNKYFYCLKYAHENGCPLDSKTCRYAAFHGILDTLKYAHENGCPWEDSCSAAASGGYIDCLKYAHENGCPWEKRIGIVSVGQFELHDDVHDRYYECFEYIHENGRLCSDYEEEKSHQENSGINDCDTIKDYYRYLQYMKYGYCNNIPRVLSLENH